MTLDEIRTALQNISNAAINSGAKEVTELSSDSYKYWEDQRVKYVAKAENQFYLTALCLRLALLELNYTSKFKNRVLAEIDLSQELREETEAEIKRVRKLMEED